MSAALPPLVPRGVIQNGARVRSQALFPVIRPLPVSPVGSRTSAIRWVNFTPVALNYIINVSQGFPWANTFPHKHTQTHPHLNAHTHSSLQTNTKSTYTHTHKNRLAPKFSTDSLHNYIFIVSKSQRHSHASHSSEHFIQVCLYNGLSHTHTHKQVY